MRETVFRNLGLVTCAYLIMASSISIADPLMQIQPARNSPAILFKASNVPKNTCMIFYRELLSADPAKNVKVIVNESETTNAESYSHCVAKADLLGKEYVKFESRYHQNLKGVSITLFYFEDDSSYPIKTIFNVGLN